MDISDREVSVDDQMIQDIEKENLSTEVEYLTSPIIFASPLLNSKMVVEPHKGKKLLIQDIMKECVFVGKPKAVIGNNILK